MRPPLARRQSIRSGRLTLVAEVAGEGPPVILLHGFPENAHSWRHQTGPIAAAGFSAWALNLRGYPPSEVSSHQADYHLRRLADDVAAAVAATGHARAAIVGHDWGGIIAWTFAGLYPALLDKLIILNAPHLQVYREKVWRSSQLLRSLYVGLFQLPLLPEKLLAAGDFRIVREMFRLMPARRGAFQRADIDRYVAGLSRPGALKAAIDYYRENVRSDGMALAASARVTAPTAIIWGERDPALGSFLIDGTERFAPRLTVHRIPDAGHWVQNEAPEEVNRYLLAFLRRN
ncbi:Pimeloyl-ACP methyl ester carboxylesterase [Noviherbaspirillum humi]|uniref:Pimeloyl-ACP methyl ester carboxylesterase n=1 Tax=Noviherbaspirillum humi TaxID=1688639 RepID=A0A239G7U5_9BURK|nr:alpha/beta hydrolase [Noviherbaspirillum humi]SNS64782.1 Pimeloyl-ACP methyl ester carboxylesterase [Noviherbaspirillum humi]